MSTKPQASAIASLLAATMLSFTAPAFGLQPKPTPRPQAPSQSQSHSVQRARSAPGPNIAPPAPARTEYGTGRPIAYHDQAYAEELEYEGDYDCGAPATVGCCDVVSACGDSCCDVGVCGSPCAAYWAELDALIWWTRGMDVPALATTGSTTGQGVLGEADTRVLYGGGALLDDSLFGGRFRLGSWLNTCQTAGLEVSYLRLEEAGDGFSASNADYAVLSRPIFNTTNGEQDALTIALPGAVSGSLEFDAESQFEALDATLLFNISQHRGGRCDFVVGYRRLELADSLIATQHTQSLAGPTAGATFDAVDRFSTRNTFNGGLFGLRFKNQMNHCWSFESSIGVALGGVQRRASVSGSTTATDTNGAVATVSGGLLALPTNMGDYSENEFGASYEVGVKLKRRLSECAALTVGYTYLAWNDVYRVGDQIDTNINPSQLSGGTLTGSANPRFPGDASNYWAQGINLGFEATF